MLIFFQLQNEKRRLERDLEEIKRQKEEQDDENERLRQEVASLRYVFNRVPVSAGSTGLWELIKFEVISPKSESRENAWNSKISGHFVSESQICFLKVWWRVVPSRLQNLDDLTLF